MCICTECGTVVAASPCDGCVAALIDRALPDTPTAARHGPASLVDVDVEQAIREFEGTVPSRLPS